MDAISALPSIFLGILVLTVLSPSYITLMFAIGVVTAPTAQRVVRASTLAGEATRLRPCVSGYRSDPGAGARISHSSEHHFLHSRNSVRRTGLSDSDRGLAQFSWFRHSTARTIVGGNDQRRGPPVHGGSALGSFSSRLRW